MAHSDAEAPQGGTGLKIWKPEDFLDPAGNWTCTKCGSCCWFSGRVLAAMEPETAAAHAFLDRGDGLCAHFDEETNLCRIYDERPAICRTPVLSTPAENQRYSRLCALASNVADTAREVVRISRREVDTTHERP